MKSCVFCDIVKGKIKSHKVYEDYSSLCVLDINYGDIGNCLLIPKKHFKDMFDMDEDTYYDIKNAIKTVSRTMKKNLNAVKVNVIFSSGEAEEKSFHFHVHIVPRYENEKEIWTDTKQKRSDFEKIMNRIKC